MANSNHFQPDLPADLETILSSHENDHLALLKAFMPVLCDHIKADRIFLQPRKPESRICKVMYWRRNEDIPLPEIPGQVVDEWFVEDRWEIEDPLWRAALNLQPSIYIEDLQIAANEGILNIDFETTYMFHTAFIHGHAHWPPIESVVSDQSTGDGRQFYGSVQPAVFDGPRLWDEEVRQLMEKCLIRIAPIMKAYGETAPSLESFQKNAKVLQS